MTNLFIAPNSNHFHICNCDLSPHKAKSLRPGIPATHSCDSLPGESVRSVFSFIFSVVIFSITYFSTSDSFRCIKVNFQNIRTSKDLRVVVNVGCAARLMT